MDLKVQIEGVHLVYSREGGVSLTHIKACLLKKAIYSSVVVLLFSVLFGGRTPALYAQEANEVWEVALSALGYRDPLRLSGAVSSQEIFVPVPAGLQPVRLRARVHRSPDVEGGFLEVRAGDRLVAAFDVNDLNADLDVSLQEVEFSGQSVPLRFLARLRGEEDVCSAALAGMWVELAEATVVLEGQPVLPQTVGEFFPPILEEVTFFVPSEPTPAEAEAVLRLSAAVVYRYAGQDVNVRLASFSPGGQVDLPSSPFARAVMVQEKGPAQAEVTGLLLRLTGDATALRAQSRLLADKLAPLLAAPSVSSLSFVAPEEVGGEQVPLSALGYTGYTVSGVGRLEVPVYFSQADLGGPVQGLALRLAGTYTPIPEGSDAVLLVLFNGALIQSVRLDQTGAFDVYIPVFRSLVRRDNTLVLRVDYTPPGGECRVGRHPLTFYLDPRSYIQVDHGQGLSPGFERFPQALLPSFQVSFDTLDLDALQGALSTVGELQRLAGTRLLKPVVVPWEESTRAHEPALLVGTDGERVAALRPPLVPIPFRVLDADGRELLRFEADLAFGALEAFEQGGRDVLLLTAYRDRTLLASTANSVRAQPQGWYMLTGDVYLFPAEEAPVTVNVRGGAVRVVPLAPSVAVWWVRVRPFVYAALLVGTLLFVAWAYPRVVRKGISTEP